MGTFIVSYDAHKVRDYSRFYKAAAENKGTPLLESMWAFEFNSTVAQVRDWARSLFDNDDSVVVLQIKPSINWATSHAPVATAWCSANLVPAA